MKKHHQKTKIRYALDEREIVSGHFAKLTRLLQEEARRERDLFKTQVLDKNPEQRERGGRALLRLVITGLSYNPSGQRLLSFGLASGRSIPRYALQVGDVVQLSGILTPKIERPSGTVYEKNAKAITVAFARQLPGWVGKSGLYQLSQSENKTTFDRMYEALREVGGAQHNQAAVLRNISLGLRKPRFHDPVTPGQVNFFNKNLNELQQKAVCLALESEDVLLVHGPPGTGKTSVLIEMIRQARKCDKSVLVSAPSNAACDHIVECLQACGVPVMRLGHPARIAEHIRRHTLGYKLANHAYAKLISDHEARLDQIGRQRAWRQEKREFTLSEKNNLEGEVKYIRDEIRNLRAEIFRQVWHVADVVVATHALCGDPAVKTKEFQWVIIDEATQGVEPATWIPASRGGKVVLAGDHFQLAPTVTSPRRGPDSLRTTLFERLQDTLEDSSKIRLERQYRMHEQIMHFSSKEFYDGQLTADESVRQHTLAGLPNVKKQEVTETPVVFLDTAGLGYDETREPGSESRFNRAEAELVCKEYEHLIKAGVDAQAIGIISPYSAQVKLLLSLLQKDEWDADQGIGPEIDSIDAFQGREKEAIIVSLVRSNLTGDIGFLGDTRRMNVALTRARRKLIVIGDSATIATLPFYQDFLRYIESIHAYRSAWEYVS
jgi:superfamily I DNA and/or RNA helicase